MLVIPFPAEYSLLFSLPYLASPSSGSPAWANCTLIDPTSAAAMSERTIKAAQVFIGALPILMVYPFLQKYFVKGIVMGAVKE